MSDKLTFGDIVINEWASKRNPQRVLMVVSTGKQITCLSREGKEVLFENDKNLRLKKVAKLPFEVWDFVIGEQKLREQLKLES